MLQGLRGHRPCDPEISTIRIHLLPVLGMGSATSLLGVSWEWPPQLFWIQTAGPEVVVCSFVRGQLFLWSLALGGLGFVFTCFACCQLLFLLSGTETTVINFEFMSNTSTAVELKESGLRPGAHVCPWFFSCSFGHLNILGKRWPGSCSLLLFSEGATPKPPGDWCMSPAGTWVLPSPSWLSQLATRPAARV